MSQDHRTFGVLFDVGYCLMDEVPRLRTALAWCAAQLAAEGVTASTAELEQRYNQACCAPQYWTESLITQIMSELLPRETALAIRRRLVWDRVPLTPYPEAVEALKLLKKHGFKVGVLANQPPSARGDLERSGLTAHLDDIWLSEAVGLSKPNPEFFKLALEAWKLPADRVAYVGDRPDNDVKPAKALGMYTVRVQLGPHRDQPAKDAHEQADVLAANLVEAAQALVAWGRAVSYK